MDRREYCRQLTQELRHLTAKEVAAVRQEFMDHMEDHAEMLREAGYDEAEADVRAVEAMGDPVETGREIDKQYPAIWLWLSRIAVAVIVIVCISALFSLFGAYTAFDSLAIRMNPYRNVDIPKDSYIDYRMEIGDDIVHFIGLEGYVPGEDCEVSLHFNMYDKSIFGSVHQNLETMLTFRTDSGDRISLSGGGSSNEKVAHYRKKLQIASDDTYITVIYDHYGRYVACTIDLQEVGK